MLGIYRFYVDCGRMGELSGLFLATADDVAKVTGKTAIFSDMLGKHSEVDIDIGESNTSLVSDDPGHVSMFGELNLTIGINPIEYVDDFGDEDEDDA